MCRVNNPFHAVDKTQSPHYNGNNVKIISFLMFLSAFRRNKSNFID